MATQVLGSCTSVTGTGRRGSGGGSSRTGATGGGQTSKSVLEGPGREGGASQGGFIKTA